MTLQFQRVYVALIMSGAKRQSLRAKLPRGAHAGAPLTLMSGYAPGAKFATATVVAVDHVPVADLTEEDAKLDGFATLEALHVALAATYPDATKVYRIGWTDLQPFTKES